MNFKNITLFLLFVTANFSLFSAEPGTGFYLKEGPSMLISKSVNFPAGYHTGAEIKGGLLIIPAKPLTIAAEGGVLVFNPSPPSSGYLYRGFRTLSASLILGLQFPLYDYTSWFIDAGAAFSFAKYDLTDIYFFYPSIYFEGGIDFPPEYSDAFNLRLGIPVYIHLREELPLSISSGIFLSIICYPF